MSYCKRTVDDIMKLLSAPKNTYDLDVLVFTNIFLLACGTL